MERVDLVGEMIYDFHWRLWAPHYKRLRFMGAPSVKLVYLYLCQCGPQNFTTIRRGLCISSRTVDKALKELLDGGFIELDEEYFFYSITYIPPRD